MSWQQCSQNPGPLSDGRSQALASHQPTTLGDALSPPHPALSQSSCPVSCWSVPVESRRKRLPPLGITEQESLPHQALLPSLWARTRGEKAERGLRGHETISRFPSVSRKWSTDFPWGAAWAHWHARFVLWAGLTWHFDGQCSCLMKTMNYCHGNAVKSVLL